MKKAIMLFTTVIVMVVVVWEKTSGKAVESKLKKILYIWKNKNSPGDCCRWMP